MNKRIKEVRKALKLTQKEIAEQVNFSENYVYMMETGKKPVSDKYITALVREVGANENWIRSGDGEMFNKTTKEEEIAEIAAKVFKEDSAFRTMLIKELCDAPVETLEPIYDYVKYIVDMNKKKNDQG